MAMVKIIFYYTLDLVAMEMLCADFLPLLELLEGNEYVKHVWHMD